MTLSGLLNFTDGLWSCCGSERIIIFTTNYIEKLDKALLRAGRMDKHIHMSWCGFDAFKTLAKNNLGLYTHSLFPEIENAIVDKAIAPADVSEVLLKKKQYPTAALEALLEFLHKSPSISEKPVVKLTLDEDSQSLTNASQTSHSKAQVDLLSVDDFQIPSAEAEGTTDL